MRPVLVCLTVVDSPKKGSLFEKMYRKYRGILYGVAISMLHNEQDAEDAVHQAFLYAAENMDKFTDGICPKTLRYLVITVRCRATDILREKDRCLPMDGVDGIQAVHQDYPGLSPLAQCIAELPERYRDALILREHYGFAYSEIGKMMRVTEANARKIVARAKSMLEELCIKEGILK